MSCHKTLFVVKLSYHKTQFRMKPFGTVKRLKEYFKIFFHDHGPYPYENVSTDQLFDFVLICLFMFFIVQGILRGIKKGHLTNLYMSTVIKFNIFAFTNCLLSTYKFY